MLQKAAEAAAKSHATKPRKHKLSTKYSSLLQKIQRSTITNTFSFCFTISAVIWFSKASQKSRCTGDHSRKFIRQCFDFFNSEILPESNLPNYLTGDCCYKSIITYHSKMQSIKDFITELTTMIWLFLSVDKLYNNESAWRVSKLISKNLKICVYVAVANKSETVNQWKHEPPALPMLSLISSSYSIIMQTKCIRMITACKYTRRCNKI